MRIFKNNPDGDHLRILALAIGLFALLILLSFSVCGCVTADSRLTKWDCNVKGDCNIAIVYYPGNRNAGLAIAASFCEDANFRIVSESMYENPLRDKRYLIVAKCKRRNMRPVEAPEMNYVR